MLVSCPIDLYSVVTITLSPDLPRSSKHNKVDKALDLYLNKKCLPHLGWQVNIQSDLLVGKGMASSTADIAAAISAAANALNCNLDAQEIADIAVQVEPSDGIMLNGIYLFNYISGANSQFIAKALPAQLVIIDPGGRIDTLKFNQQQNLYYLNLIKKKEVKYALRLVSHGLKSNDLEMLGRGATLSALANQHILPKSELPTVLKFAQDLQAVGVTIAHSGTVMGLIFHNDMTIVDIPTYIKRKKPHWRISLARFINGGVDRGDKGC